MNKTSASTNLKKVVPIAKILAPLAKLKNRGVAGQLDFPGGQVFANHLANLAGHGGN